MRDNRPGAIAGRIDSLKKREHILNRLRSSVQGLDTTRLRECTGAILEGYQTTSIARYLGQVKDERYIERYRYKSIGFHHRISRREFNASDYYWTPYFSDIGRGVALGEKKYIFRRLGRYIRGCKQSISRTNPNFETINMKVHEMLTDNIIPNTIICPISMFVDFVKHYHPHIDWSNVSGEILRIGDCNLRTIWSSSNTPLRSFIILDSNAATWHSMADRETGDKITIAIGMSADHDDHDSVEYWVEALAYYSIDNAEAFTRINLSK